MGARYGLIFKVGFVANSFLVTALPQNLSTKLTFGTSTHPEGVPKIDVFFKPAGKLGPGAARPFDQISAGKHSPEEFSKIAITSKV